MTSPVRGTHYSLAQSPAEMWQKAAAIAAKLIADAKAHKAIPVLAYTGMSGTATATAVSLWLATKKPRFKFYMIYVRKPREKSHGRKIEHNFEYDFLIDESITKKKFFIAFVDDLICSGATSKRVLAKIAAECKTTNYMLFTKLAGAVNNEGYCTSDY
jgi:orotate phosphoribosyltransferase-like protein